MKKLMIIMLVAFLGLAANAQKRNVSITTDTVQGAETVYFAPSYSYTYTGVDSYAGLVGFQFTKTDVADSLSALTLQGSYDGTNYVAITSSGASLTETTTDGNLLLYEANPLFSKYRLAATCASGNSVIFTNVRYIHKLTEE